MDGGGGSEDPGDLSLDPDSYPGTPIASPTLVLADCQHLIRPRWGRPVSRAIVLPCPPCSVTPGQDRSALSVALRRVGADPMEQRTAVVAVGSNASAAVMRHKLSSRGVSPVVPMVTGILRNIAVVHSAHVSRGGYVPAAPVHLPGVRSRVAVQFLDADQLAAVDATEPNYERVPLDPTRHLVVLSGGWRPADPWIYASRRGVLRGAGLGTGLLTQADLRLRLVTHDLPALLAQLAAPDGLSDRPRHRPRRPLR